MLIRELHPLVQQKLGKITPSNLNWILKCPLRAVFANNANRVYLNTSASSYSMIGNVIHKMNEDFIMGEINSEEDFELKWAEYEQQEKVGGLRAEVKNYGIFKATTRTNILELVHKRRNDRSNFNKYKFLPEEPLKDISNHIEGKLDLLILYDGRPFEIRDYKTGNIYDLDAAKTLNEDGASCDDNIKEDYKKQLFLYAWLVKDKYGQLPQKLTIVTNEGAYHPIEFEEADVLGLMSEIEKLKRLLDKNDMHLLPNPSEENCKYCNFRFDCRFRVSPLPEPIGDLSGQITSVIIFPYGNLSLTLDGKYKVVFPNKVESPEVLSSLKGASITISFVRRHFFGKEIPNGLSEIYVPTKRTELLKMI